MKLRIKKCPKCSSTQFYTSTTGKATCNLIYDMESESDDCSRMGQWDFDNGKQKEDVRCGNCYLSLKRYIVKED